MSIERLVKEFGAQDVGAYMVTFIGGTHERVAQWIAGSDVWNILPAGTALLSPESVVESVDMLAGTEPAKHSRKAKFKVETAPAADALEGLDDL